MIDWESEDAIRIRAAYHHAMRAHRKLDLLDCLSIEADAERRRTESYEAEQIIDATVTPPHGGLLTANVRPPTLSEPTKETSMNEKPWPTEAEYERRQRSDHRAAQLDRRIIAADRQAES